MATALHTGCTGGRLGYFGTVTVQVVLNPTPRPNSSLIRVGYVGKVTPIRCPGAWHATLTAAGHAP
jgi:hypothetical protein